MDYIQLEDKVNKWAEDKGIFDKGTTYGQADKTIEEAQEIKDALLLNDRSELIDALGDTLVTLIIQAKMNDLDLLQCLNVAYGVISKREGEMIGGVFVKNTN